MIDWRKFKDVVNSYYLETDNASYIFIEPNVIIKEHVEEFGDFEIKNTEVREFHQEEELLNFCRSEKIPVPPLKNKIVYPLRQDGGG